MNERLGQLVEAQGRAKAELSRLEEARKRLETDITMRAGRIAELQYQIQQAEPDEPEDETDG